jgi:putative pyruvate formate lyase activating enzyme
MIHHGVVSNTVIFLASTIIMNYEEYFTACRLCPRQCGVNRLRGKTGFCGELAQLRVASIGVHFGEEPPISGTRGSGTVFFSGCTLKCSFCQNYQLSHLHLGDTMTVVDVVHRLEELSSTQGIHNVNFVTPDHFFPYTREIVRELRKKNVLIPIVYNMSGYECVESLRNIEEYADIYLPDFKYADNRLAAHLSHCQNYSSIALDALAEMIRQKGFLDTFLAGQTNQIAQQGVLVRHLILPGQVQNSCDALSMLFLEFGKNLPVSLMSQYHPVAQCINHNLQRRITDDEFRQVYEHALSLGLQNLFIQYPEMQKNQPPEFLPDFTKAQPFKGNRENIEH